MMFVRRAPGGPSAAAVAGGRGIVSFYSQISSIPNSPDPVNPPKSLPDALSVFHHLIATEPLPPIQNFNDLLLSLGKMRHHSTVLSLFREMAMLHLPCNLTTFNTAIYSCCHLKHVDYGLSLLGAIAKHGYAPDLGTFHILIEGLLTEVKVIDALTLFHKLNGVVKDCPPTKDTYHTVIEGLSKSGNVDAAVGFVEQMVGNGVRPDLFTYNSLIKGFCKLGQMDKALEVLNSMVEGGVSPTIHMYNVLLSGYCNAWKMNKAMLIFRELTGKGVEPNMETYCIMVCGLTNNNRLFEALELLQTMEDGGIVPNIVCYAAFIKGLCKAGRIEDALGLYKQVLAKGMQPDVVICNTIIDGLFKDGKLEDACIFFSQMTNQGVKPDAVTYKTMVVGLRNEGYASDSCEAKRLLKEMEKNGFKSDEGTFNNAERDSKMEEEMRD